MQTFNRFLVMCLFSCAANAEPSSAHPYFVFADYLYWGATEVIDWAYDNNLNPSNQTIAYQTNHFEYQSGYRLGVGYEQAWDIGFYYTDYSTKTSDSANGNLKSGFFGGTAGLPNGHPFYNSGHFAMDIDFKMLDGYVGKRFDITPSLMLHPTIGLEGGWINQGMRADLQGYYITTEHIHNDFSGVGPKMGIDGALNFLQRDGFDLALLAGFSAAYLWGHWEISDVFYDNAPKTIHVNLTDRNMGALAMQGMMGLGFTYHDLSLKLSYELNDWFEQCQIFDDATGAHNNDLILQGLSAQLSYHL